MKHVVETSGRIVPALESAPALSSPHAIEGLRPGVASSGLTTIERVHARDGSVEICGVFASPALAQHFLRTFGCAPNSQLACGAAYLDTCPEEEARK